MAVVDIHAHILSEELLDAMAAAGMRKAPRLEPHDDDTVVLAFAGGGRFGPIPIDLIDVDRRLRDMDVQGVDIQVVAAVPMLFAHDEPPAVGAAITQLTNDSLLALAAAHPERLQVLASLPMQDAQAAIAEVERVAAHDTVRGVQIAPHVAGANLDDPTLFDLWAALEQRHLPVLVHPCPPVIAGERLTRYHLSNLIGNPMDSTVAIASLIFGGVLEACPDLRFGFVHGGGYSPYQIGRWDHGWKHRPEARVHIDAPPSTYYRRMYFDTLTHDTDALRFLGTSVGWDHVIVGTDYPFDMSDRDPVRSVTSVGLTASQERLVLEDNAAAFLRPMPT